LTKVKNKTKNNIVNEKNKVHFLNLGKYKIEKIFNKAIPKQDLKKARKKIKFMALNALINATMPIEKGNSKKNAFRMLPFLNFTNTSTKAMIANTTIEK
jgi:hypothetical protein